MYVLFIPGHTYIYGITDKKSTEYFTKYYELDYNVTVYQYIWYTHTDHMLNS